MAAAPVPPIAEPEPDLDLADFERPFTVDLDALLVDDENARAEHLAKMQEFKRVLTLNPLWGFMPHSGELGYKTKHHGHDETCPTCKGLCPPPVGNESRGQVEFLELTALGVFLGAVVASNRFGKTEINVVEAAIQTLPWEYIPPWLKPYKALDPAKRDIRMRFIGPDKDHWRDKTMVPKMIRMLPPSALLGGNFGSAWKAREGTLTFADGSWWDFLTHDMETDAFASVDLDAVRLDEEMTGEQGQMKWDESIRGLTDRAGYIRATLTPVEGIGWLHDELADPDTDLPRKDLDAWCVTGSIEHNPHISRKGRERSVKAWAKRGESVLLARSQGLWVHKEGLIFPEFVRELEQPPGSERMGGHLRGDRPLPRLNGEWTVPVFEALDPGINIDHPFGFTIGFLNNAATDVFGMDDVLEIFFAFKEANLSVNQQAAIVHEARARFGYKPAFTVIDPAAKSRNQETKKELVELWREEGIYPIFGQNSRALTYEALHMRMSGPVEPGQPPNPQLARYRIWKSIDPLLGDEFGNYRWKKPSGRTENVPRPEPIKRNDDLVDTQRYMVSKIPVWRGEKIGDDELPAEAMHPQRELLKRHLREMRRQARRGRSARVGGVWGSR